MSNTVNPDLRMIIVGEQRHHHWPEEVPSIDHPLMVRLEERENQKGETRTIIAFDHGVTGHEAYELSDHFFKELDKDGDWSLCGGSSRWPSLKVSTKAIRHALEKLQNPGKATWVAHVSYPMENGTRDRQIITRPNDRPEEFYQKGAERYFDQVVGLDPDRNHLKAMLDRTPKPVVHTVFLAPEGQELMPHWDKLRAQSELSGRRAQEAFQALSRDSRTAPGRASAPQHNEIRRRPVRRQAER